MEVNLQEKVADWKVIQLENLSKDEKSSFVIGPFGSDLVQSDYRSSGVPVVFVRDIKRNKFKWKSNVYLTKEKAAQLQAHSVLPGDIIVTKMGLPPGIAALYPYDMETGIVTADILRLRPSPDKVDSTFLCNYLNGYHITKQVYQRTAGQTRPKLTLADYKTIKISLPPLPEQKKIARILSTWDKAIETVEKLIENSQAQKKALMLQLLTGKRRLPGFDGEWENVVVGDCLIESKVHSTNNDPTRRLTVRLNLNGIEHRECRGTEAVDATCHFVRSSGQFIYGKQNIHKGAFGIIPDRFDGFETSQDIPCFDFKGQCSPIWFFYLFSRNSFYRGLECLMTGTGSKRLNQKVFLKIKIKLPPLKEQKKIASVLTTADKEIQTLQQKLDCLKQEKKALMQQLLTGKRRVKVDADG